jgi:hypothetical protein
VTPARRWIVACVALGLILRLIFGLFYWTGKPLTHDEREYLALARSLVRGDGFSYPTDEPSPGTGQQFGRAPGYPLFLALLAVKEPVDVVPVRVKVAQAVVGTLGVWLIAAIALGAAGPRAGVTAAALAAVHPPLVFMPAYALSETLYSMVVLLLAWAWGRWDPVDDRRHLGTILAAILTAVAILVRPSTLFFVLLAILWIATRQRPPSRTLALQRAAIFAAVTTACVAPWTIRNALVYHRFIPVASEGGVTFWTGNHPLARGDGDLAANLPIKKAELEFRGRHPGVAPEDLEPLYYQDAFAWIREHPGSWVALVLRKAFYTIVPIGPSYTLHSPKYYAATAGAYLALLVPAIPGAWLLMRRGNPPVALWLMAASTVIAGLIFFPQERFRIPVIDPALIVAASGVAAFWGHERTRRRSDV